MAAAANPPVAADMDPAIAAAVAHAGHHGAMAAGAATVLDISLSDLHLTQPSISQNRRNQLAAHGIVGNQAISVYFYIERGPQLMRRMLVTLMRKVFPNAIESYRQIQANHGLGPRGSAWNRQQCEQFFTAVLGPEGEAGSAPWPTAAELRPVAVLSYLSRLLSWLLGNEDAVTAADVNELIIPGGHEWQVDLDSLEEVLGVPPAELAIPLIPLQQN